MKFKARYLIYLALIIIIAALAYAYSATYTPHGRLDFRAALSLRLLSPTVKMKPDPDFDIEYSMPINLFYPLSMVLPKENVSKTEDVNISGNGIDIPARVYWPKSMDEAATPLPVIVYYHGGGFTTGSVDIFDSLTRSIANAANAIVISVDYRLAPAHPYPAAFNDCYAALVWAAEHAEELGGDRAKLVVGGDSAGGNLATVVALKATNESGPEIAAQILYYPGTDLTDKQYASIENFADGYGLSAEAAAGFKKAYVGHVEDKSDPYISPLYAPSLDNMPPALIVMGGFDRLADSAKLYAERLEQSNVPVSFVYYPEMVHGFMSIQLFSQRRKALDETRNFLNGVFSNDIT